MPENTSGVPVVEETHPRQPALDALAKAPDDVWLAIMLAAQAISVTADEGAVRYAAEAEIARLAAP